MTIAEIVDRVLPNLVFDRDYVHVLLVTDKGSQAVPQEVWHRAKPHAGVHVVVRIVPGSNVLKSILQIVVSIAAIAIGAYFAPALAGLSGLSVGSAQGLITLGTTPIGSLQVNALLDEEDAS